MAETVDEARLRDLALASREQLSAVETEGVPGHGLTLSVQGGQALGQASFTVSAAEVRRARSGGLSLFALWVDPEHDLALRRVSPESFRANLESIGRVLVADQAGDRGAWRQWLLVSPIADGELLATAAEIPPGQIRAVDSRLPADEEEPAAGPPGGGSVRLRVADAGDRDALDLVVQRRQVEMATQGVHNLYAVWVHRERDLAGVGRDLRRLQEDISAVGQVLALDQEHQGAWRHLLAASRIEDSAAAALAFDLPAEQVVRLPAPVLGEALRAAAKAQPASAPAAHKAAPSPPPNAAQGPATHAPPPETIRVGVSLVDDLINLAGELVLGRNQLKMLLAGGDRQTDNTDRVMQTVDMVTSELQEHIMQLRMQPVGRLFDRFPRMVRDLARQLDKEAELEIQGGEVELDKSILEQLTDPLTHLVRNSVDHGLESPERRRAAGKPPVGRIVLRAFHKEGQVNITVADDGMGIDPERVADRALASGLVSQSELQAMGPADKVNLITRPGLSTAEEVSELSGRGVGMDVVSTNLAKVGGHLRVDTQPGVGTTMRLRLPLTLAIIPSLIVGAGGQTFAIPQADVRELVRVLSSEASCRIEIVGDAAVLRLRGRLLPLVRLSQLLGLEPYFIDSASGERAPDRRLRLADRRRESEPDQTGPAEAARRERRAADERRQRHAGDINVVVLRLGSHRYGLVVEELFDTEEIVVKPLARHLKDADCYSGCTIMGDGRVAMILDAAGMAKSAGLHFSEIEARQARDRDRERPREAGGARMRSVVLFSCGPNQFFAAPLDSVGRLERVTLTEIEVVGGRECIQYRGAGLPLLRLEDLLPVKGISPKADHLFVIIPRGPSPAAGVAAAQVVDIVDTDVRLRKYRGPVAGLAGIAPLGRHLTLFLNLEELVDSFVGQT